MPELENDRRALGLELLPFLAEIMQKTRPAPGIERSWVQVVHRLGLTLRDVIEEIKRQESQK